MFGRIFAYLAVVRSGRLLDAGATAAAIDEIVQDLIVLYGKKVYLRPLTVGVMVEMIRIIPLAMFKNKIYPLISSLVETPPADVTPETITLIAAIKQMHGVCCYIE